MLPTSEGAIDAAPKVECSAFDRSYDVTSGCDSADQKKADTGETTRKSTPTIARRKRCKSKVGITIVAPRSASVGSSCELQPVTWNSGTDTRLRMGSLPSRSPRT